MIAQMLAAIARPAKALARNRRFRHATSRARVLPSFIIIGAQRAGTTSLFDYLCRHPDVAGPTAVNEDIAWSKELHFFDDRFPRGLGWYRGLFPLAFRRRLARVRGGDFVAGEATPYYLFHPAVPERVAGTLPDVRLIALLRDPIERAYSHYQLAYRKGREQLSFEDALAAESERLAEDEPHLHDPHYRTRHHRHHSYLARGLYAEQLERWFAHFPREQLLVLQSEDFLARPAETYEEVLAFLGLRPWRLDHFEQHNRGSYAPIDPALRARLEDHFAEPNARLEQLLGREFGWGAAGAARRAARVAGTPAD
jgi:Sulfotransferase domain